MLAIVTTMSLVVLHATLDGDAAAPSAPEAAPARVADGRGGAEPAPPPKRGGALRVLTYNVAGLPDFVSDSTPSVNHALISPLLNDFDLAVVQEAFHYHRRLASQAHHPFVIEADPDPWPIFEGDGLAFFSSRPLSEPLRETWEACNGTFSQYSDCLASKGVTRTELHLGPEVAVDVYNLHMDAGEGEGDVAARGAQIEQLLRLIARRSEGRAVIVAGDTNLDVAQPDDRRHLQHLIDAAGLADGCWATRCDDEHIDRILFRGKKNINLNISQ